MIINKCTYYINNYSNMVKYKHEIIFYNSILIYFLQRERKSNILLLF